jgi:hypothetical protein
VPCQQPSAGGVALHARGRDAGICGDSLPRCSHFVQNVHEGMRSGIRESVLAFLAARLHDAAGGQVHAPLEQLLLAGRQLHILVAALGVLQYLSIAS